MKANTDPLQEAKKNAALEAVKHLKDNSIVGLGSGTTAAFAIQALGERVKKERLKILGIPSSYQAFMLAVESGVTITTLDEHPKIDVNIDGADQVTKDLQLIKGMGAALAREKIVAKSSRLNIIVVDEHKKVQVLGENNQAVPIEVIPFALPLLKQEITKLGGAPVVREGKGKLGPIITDNGNAIIDASFGPITSPSQLEVKLKMIPGVVETGLFVDLADIAYVATSKAVEKIEHKRSNQQ